MRGVVALRGCLAATLSLALVGALFWVPAALFWLEISPSGLVEESVGYRYFYSLRLAYGGEHPWLPQGQLPTLTHVLIQWALSAAYPVDQLLPRMDVFSLVAVAAPAVLTIAAACFALLRLPHWSSMIIVSVAAIVLMASPQLPGGIGWTTMPDYHVWVLPLAFTCLALALTDQRLTLRQAVALGLVAGLAVGVKITLFVFPLVPLLARLPLNRHALGLLLVSGVVATLVYLTIIALYSGVDLQAVVNFFVWLDYFRRTQTATVPADAWAQILGSGYDLFAVCLLPVALIVLGIALRERLAFAAAFALILSLTFAGQRLYAHTLVEVYALAILALGVLVAIITRRTTETQLCRFLWPSAAVASLCLLLTFGTDRIEAGYGTIHHARDLNQAFARWRERLAPPTWIATTSNDYRPQSLESAICKGSRDIFAPNVTPYIASLLPNFRCALSPNELIGIDISSIGYLRLPTETLDAAIKRVEGYFSVSLAKHHCQEISSPGAFLVYCLPQTRRAE